MVTANLLIHPHATWMLVAQSDVMFHHLTPLDRLRAIMGLIVIIVLGVVLMMVVRAGSHMARGLSAAADRLPPSSQPDEDDWASRPLNEPRSDDS